MDGRIDKLNNLTVECPQLKNDGQTAHNGMWLVIASGMTIFFFLKTGLNLKETLAKNILAYVSVNFSIK